MSMVSTVERKSKSINEHMGTRGTVTVYLRNSKAVVITVRLVFWYFGMKPAQETQGSRGRLGD